MPEVCLSLGPSRAEFGPWVAGKSWGKPARDGSVENAQPPEPLSALGPSHVRNLMDEHQHWECRLCGYRTTAILPAPHGEVAATFELVGHFRTGHPEIVDVTPTVLMGHVAATEKHERCGPSVLN